MKIGELSKATNVAASTIRYYDSIGLLGDVSRISGSTRRFNEQTVLRIGLIKGLQNMGFSLKQIPIFFQQPNTDIDHQQILATISNQIAEMDKLMSQLQSQKQKMLSVKNKLQSTWDKGDCLNDQELQQISRQMA